ncbi:hypothetical protein BFW92_28545, partial [Pseudomonas fluorescens]
QGGQLGKLTLRFRVRDVVENFSGEKYQYSKPYFLEAELDPSLLPAPIFLVDDNELESRQIDFDTQSEARFEVIAFTPRQTPNPSPKHQIIVTLLGMLADGTVKPFVLEPVEDTNFNATYIPIDADIIAQLVGGSFRASFLWQTSSGVPLGRSGSVTITVVGTQVAMPAPQVSPMELGLIPPGEDITVTIPYYEPHSISWLETLVIEYVPPGGGGAITFRQPQLAGDQGGTRTVTAAELEPFTRRGNINIYYKTDNGEAHVRGGSALGVRRSNMLVAQIGDRTADMPEPKLQGAIGNNIDPTAVPGDEVLVTFTYLGTQVDDTLYWSCIGSGLNGSASGSILINAATAGKELPYPVPRRILDNNLNGSLRISYSLKRKGPPPLVLRSEVAAFTVGRGVQLDRPIIDGASLFPDELNPLAALDGGRVIVKFRPMLATDQINVDWLSIDGIGSDTQQVDGNPATNEVSVLFDPRTIAQGIRDGGNTINVQYHFNRGLFPFKSENVPLRLLPLTGLPTPAIDGIPGPILELSRLSPTARTRIPVWHFIHKNQRMWMTYEGIDSNGDGWSEDTYTANLVTDDGVTNGINPPTPVDKLKLLKDGSTLKISFWVSLAESLDKNTAILFGVREYIIQALPGVLPHPFIGGASGVGPNVTVEPLTIEHNTTVTVAFDGMRSTDRITLEWIFADCTSHTEIKNGLDSGTLVFILTDDKVLHRSVNSTVMLRYSVVPEGVIEPIPSEVQTVRVNAIPAEDLPQPLINGIEPGGTLDLNTFAGDATAAVKKWPLSATGQRVWLTCSSHGVADLNVLTAYPITAAEAAVGLANKAVLRNWLQHVKSGQISIMCKVTFDGSTDEMTAVPLQQSTYDVRWELGIIESISVGEQPHWIAITPDGLIAYVTNFNSHTVSVIDVEQRKVIRTIAGFDQPFRIALNPDGSRLYVGNQGARTVSVVNTSNDTITNTIPGFNFIHGLAINATGTLLFVSCSIDSMVFVHDAITGQRLNSIRVVSAYGVAINPEQTLVYAGGPTLLSFMSAAGFGSVIGSIPNFNSASNIAFNPNNKPYPRGYVTSSTEVVIFNSSTNTIVKRLAGFNNAYDVVMNPTPNTAECYVSSDGTTLSVIDTNNETVIHKHLGFHNPAGIAVAHGGRLALVANQANKTVSFVAL